MRCPQCRAEVSAGARFCQSCGHELLVVGDQRRIATVLFADLVGFTALSERLDPEQVKALVDRCFERLAADIETFGGRVDKVVGDAIVALFGAPVAHEDDAERAVRAGLRMQETIAVVGAEVDHVVQLRIGINTGEVLVGAVQAGREYTAMGDVVNTASRLQTAARPGTVLVGPATHAATQLVVEYADVEPIDAKGKELPVDTWVALRATAPPGHRPQRHGAPMVGRDTELHLLTSVATTAIDRSRAAMLVVHGEAGMGKSRLAAEAAKFAEDRLDTLVLQGRCVPYGEANVWWPVADAVRTAAGIHAESPPDEVDAKLRAAATLALDASGRLGELDRVVAGLHHLLGHDPTDRNADTTRSRDEAIRSVVAMADGYTHRRPLLVMLSDLHWADDEVLELIETLLARLARRPFVLLATARRSLRERWSPNPEAANSVVLHLDPLGAEASRRLLHELTDGELHPALASMLVDRAAGNPFYLEELVSLIREAGVQSVDQLLARDGGELPTTLRGLVAARIDALAPADRTMLDDASVLGRRSKISALVTMAAVKRNVDEEMARAQVENLAAREFFVIDGDQYAFRSDVIREVTYGTLTKADRARSHAGIAAWIEGHESAKPDHEFVGDQVASHYAAAAELVADIGRVPGVPDDIAEHALRWLTVAIERADDDYLPAVAAQLATRALGIATEGHPRRAHLLRLRADAYCEQFELDAAVVDAEEALALAQAADDRDGEARAWQTLGEVAQHRGDFLESVELLGSARKLFEDAADARGAAVATRLTGVTHLLSGDFAAADDTLSEALERFEAIDDVRGVAWTLQNLSWSAYTSGQVDEAEERILQAMATFEEIGDPGGMTWSRGLLAWVRFHQGRNDEAQALADAVGLDAHERGERWGEAMMVVLTSAIALWSGRTADAIDAGTLAADLFESIDDTFGLVQARCGLARAQIMSGEVDAGIDELVSIAGAVARPGVGPDQAWFPRIAMLACAVQLGDVGLGHVALEGVDDATGPGQVGGADRLVAMALHALQSGDHDRALATIGHVDEDRGYVDAGRALVEAVAGSAEAALHHADCVAEHPHTYLDSTYAAIGRALARHRLDDVDGADDAIADATELVDGTQDRLAQAVVRLVDASLADRCGRPDAPRRREIAELRLADLGVAAAGWRALLGDALGALTPA